MTTITLYDFSVNDNLLYLNNLLKKRMQPPMRILLHKLYNERKQIINNRTVLNISFKLYITHETWGKLWINESDAIIADLNLITIPAKKYCLKYIFWFNSSYWIVVLWNTKKDGFICKQIQSWKSFKIDKQRCDYQLIDKMRTVHDIIKVKANFDPETVFEYYVIYYLCKYNPIYILINDVHCPCCNKIKPKDMLILDLNLIKYLFDCIETSITILKKHGILITTIDIIDFNDYRRVHENEILHILINKNDF